MLKSILDAATAYREMKASKRNLQLTEENTARMITDSNESLAIARMNLENTRKENEAIVNKIKEGEAARKEKMKAYDEKRRELEDPTLTLEQRLVLIKQLGELSKNIDS
tara:strand:- start:875 stop:1201 length:327 start_codon:yes stop_codon:yes gene_type:complete